MPPSAKQRKQLGDTDAPVRVEAGVPPQARQTLEMDDDEAYAWRPVRRPSLAE
jgi:hypothetical protein